MVSYEGNLYVYGGRLSMGSQYFNTVARYMPSRSAWHEVEGKGSAPMRRGDHSAVVVDDKMFVYGGRKQNIVFEDLYAFDFVLKTWEQITFDASSSPGAIFNHSAVYSSATSTMFVVGGVHLQGSRRNFVFGYDMRGRYWRSIRGPPTVDPGELQHCVCCLDEVGAKLIVAGAREDPTLSAMYNAAQATFTQQQIYREDDDRSDAGDIGLGGRAGSINGSRSASIGLGGLKNKMTGAAEMSFTMMHMMDVHTKIWKRIRTEISPESPIIFSMQHVASAVINNITKQCCAMSMTKRLWYFIVNLREVDVTGISTMVSAATHRRSVAPSSSSLPPTGRSAKGKREADSTAQQPPWMATFGHEYGVFCLSLTDLTWTLSPLIMPKIKKNPLPGDEGVTRRETFSMRTAQDFERKYAFVVHSTGNSANLKETLALYGGNSTSDYACAVATPSLPPRPQGNALDVLAQRNRARQAMGWSLDDDALHEQNDDSISKELERSGKLADSTSPTNSVSQNNLIPPAIASTPKVLSPQNASLVTMSGGMQHPVLQLGKGGAKRRKASQAIRVLVPYGITAGSGTTSSMSHSSVMGGSNPPVNVVDSKEKLNLWIHQNYREECKWISEQRFATEKHFVLAKRAAAKAKANVRGDREVNIPIPPANEREVSSARLTQQRKQANEGASERRELRIRSGAIVGTLLLDSVDLHPDVKPRLPPAKPSSPRRRSSFFNRRASLPSDKNPTVVTMISGDGAGAPPQPMEQAPMSIAKMLPHLRGQKKIDEADTEASRIARVRWAILRKYVLSGAAARILSVVEESKCPDISWWVPHSVSSSSQLVMSPSLSTFTIIKSKDAASNNKRVMAAIPTKPVPYQLQSKNFHQLDAVAQPSGAMLYTPRLPVRPKS
ncbi:Hypothetical protein, putative [Bodo saltans]|uniref:Uncharacterized protein n=1 Tax=Bodo saltans TaxID=75058 RepID=A0A0S4JCH2_BODSA|nr:Hypothetical protein, putative [Bodo saltans]|eukprot:CUG89073.1 Hypothetical protein, putative [Bodo saltans]